MTKALQKKLAAAGRRLDYVFVSHTEPDHSGLIVLDRYPVTYLLHDIDMIATEMVDLLSVDPQELVAVMGHSKGLDVGAEMLAPPLRVKDLPAQPTYQLFEEEGTDLAQALTAKETIARKDRAIESLMQVGDSFVLNCLGEETYAPLMKHFLQVGDSFVLNCLGEETYAPLMKHFLQRFAPGADRFEGVDWFPAPSTTCPVLTGAIAYMECRVVSRLETPDHWVTYCEVIAGNVTNSSVRTAVNRRKVANYY
ncbi:hypothetical protein GPECTOR_122g456 [Gonium pectorale]|uniref:Flavin reductase like domain-containing protein n=1 Tax=Gonium pectorale TaxID=33097 RepID=A0A150FZR9_GONPE|nr:hypothetical protein GPECTOR_122g456 [Gonium pectorale]|eukprot:KXZ42715.1 hypothetical protein GPECTOR_122g456 [Gonium pectorale]